ncbi:serine hydrolase domain-containing protein [Pedobacter heparinus]|uniref:Beta-lactamase n=1 Tax=Pedobacter heparinus (strain ATCC 13125 / DSM 2366 / CIP 104194 / JCM 7457 / NBRC 12017 / NCIMB 9290 / NRRL B-14731 / HIM 762-3) TaxID=485917 RepID=C6XY17_PEDHD|nr:serine hydrolase domain-containing protein [Pedobacter heparinus]ACU04435.1 beta-lactamase [Pedobacter heparinus DSM 2366]
MTTITSLKYYLIVVLTICTTFSGLAQVKTAEAEAELKSIMKKLEVVGLSVAVVKKGELIYSNSFGLKDIEKNTLLENRDIFRIASISKSFSATSILQFVDAGKVSLDDDFSNLVGFKVRNPKYPNTVITLKMVMSHTSSINDSEGYFNLDAINPEKNVNWAKCYNNYEPGKGYRYCNLNYNMVGAVIEKLSGERFDQYVKHHILDRLGLYGGYCVDSLDASRFATLYEYDAAARKFNAAPLAYAPRSEDIRNYIMGYSTPIFSPTGGMKISATDLAKYMTMHMNLGKYKGGRIISKKSAKIMQTKVSDEEGYGLAILTTADMIPGKVMKGHTGSAYGLYSAMFFQPDEKFGIVVITNGCNPTYTRGFNDVLRATVSSLYNSFIK